MTREQSTCCGPCVKYAWSILLFWPKILIFAIRPPERTCRLSSHWQDKSPLTMAGCPSASQPHGHTLWCLLQIHCAPWASPPWEGRRSVGPASALDRSRSSAGTPWFTTWKKPQSRHASRTWDTTCFLASSRSTFRTVIVWCSLQSHQIDCENLEGREIVVAYGRPLLGWPHKRTRNCYSWWSACTWARRLCSRLIGPGFIACPIVLVIPTGVLPGRGLSGKLAGDEGPTPINDATYERGVRSYLQVSLRVNP